MTSVTVFSIGGCPHCSRAKKYLESADVSYTVVSLDDYPQSRKGMLELAGALSVPQVFFGNKHIGGADEVCGLSRDALVQQVSEAEAPTDPRLQLPEGPPVPKLAASPRAVEEYTVDGKSFTYVQLAAKLENTLERRDATVKFTTYKSTASEGDILRCLQSTDKSLMKTLLEAGFIQQCAPGLYCLTSQSEPMILNKFRKWTDRVDPPMVILASLRSLLGDIKSRHRGTDGKLDYIAMTNDVQWPQLREALCELQAVKLRDLGPAMRKAFVINCYNLLITVAFAVLGIPQSSLKRLAFFNDVKVELGGLVYSFNDLENGILRGNRKAPYSFSFPFGKGDERLGDVMPVDKRIHFALNCGAASCPPVKSFTPDSIDLELDIVSSAFCESSDNVAYETAKKELTVSQIFKWYAADFGSTQELIAFLATVTRGEKAAALRAAPPNSNIKYFPYSWDTDASNAETYKGAQSTQAGAKL